MGGKLARRKLRSGFCAETSTAAALFATHLGLPVSTTHAIAGAIAGVGSVKRMKAVRWGIARNIAGARVLTVPAAAPIAYPSSWVLRVTRGA
jgi:PiT family inorganic phosphate transporter